MSEQVQYTISLNDIFSQQLAAADANAKRFESTVKGIGLAVAGAFGLNSIKGFVMGMVDAGSKVENAKTGLTTLLKNASEAQAVINNTMEDATKTPFAFEGLLAANKALISADESAVDARAAVLDLANAIAATGGGDDELQRMVVNLQQIKNTGKATALDIKQFAYAGINVYKLLADATGQPITKVKDMEVSYDLLTMALKKAHDEGGLYASGLENMAGNTSVQISNLGDAAFQLSVQMFDDLKPAIDVVISGMAGAIETAREMWDWLVKNQETVKEVGTYLAIAGGAWLVYKGIMLGQLLVTQSVVLWQGIQTAAMAVLGPTIFTASIATQVMAAAQWALNVAMEANPIGLVIGALVALGIGIMALWKHFAGFRGFIMGTWEVIKEFGRIVTDIFGGLYKTIKGALTFDGDLIKEGFAQQADAMFNAGQRMGTAFKKGYDGEVNKADADQEGKDRQAMIDREDAAESKLGLNKPKAKPLGTPTAPAGAKSSVGKGQGPKVINITVTIGNLIDDFTISTTNIGEGVQQVKKMVAGALMSATNEFQLAAAGS